MLVQHCQEKLENQIVSRFAILPRCLGTEKL
jgi:hypothetical protein